jgi:hypothetical protein
MSSAAGWTNQKVWIEVQAGYRLPCPNGCAKEIHDRMMACWKADPHERPLFRGLTTFFRNQSVALGTIAQYDMGNATMRPTAAKKVNDDSARAAQLIQEAIKEGKRNGKKAGKLESAGQKQPLAMKQRKGAERSLSPATSEDEPGVSESYVDLVGKVCGKNVCVCVCVCVCVFWVCVCVCIFGCVHE